MLFFLEISSKGQTRGKTQYSKMYSTFIITFYLGTDPGVQGRVILGMGSWGVGEGNPWDRILGCRGGLSLGWDPGV